MVCENLKNKLYGVDLRDVARMTAQSCAGARPDVETWSKFAGGMVH